MILKQFLILEHQMKHITLLTTATLVATTLILPLSVQAEGWQVLPVMKQGYKPDFAVAVVAGTMEADDDNTDKYAPVGVELSMNCPLLKAPSHDIRQQISYLQSDKNGVKSMAFELSPHHMYKVANKLTIGFGPALGYTKVEKDTGSDGVFTYGAGVSTRYNISKGAFVGAEARYVKAQELEVNGVKSGFDNGRAVIKLGYQF